MMQPAPLKATTKNRIGYKKTKLDGPVYLEKLKRKQLEKKLEDNDPDYEPDIANCKHPPESIAVQENDDLPGKAKDVLDSLEDIGVCHVPDTVPDGMQNIQPPPESCAVTIFNMNDDHEILDSSCTFAFVAINYSPKIGGIGK
jgi:hypothetical protein